MAEYDLMDEILSALSRDRAIDIGARTGKGAGKV
jgi:hypothetical protein